MTLMKQSRLLGAPGNIKDLVTGLLFVVAGAAYALTAYSGLAIGTARNMGPGYFPLVLSCALILIGLIVALKSFAQPFEPITRIPFRALFMVLLAPIVLSLTLQGLGFVPSVLLTGLIASLATPEAGVVRSLFISACITALSAVIFVYGLGFSSRMFGPWLGF